jgi:ABC-type multidrug transport system ATPase subunit
LRSAHLAYDRVTAVDDVSFRVERGEIRLRSAGKTTTMRS